MHVKSESLGYFEVWIVSEIRAIGVFIAASTLFHPQSIMKTEDCLQYCKQSLALVVGWG